jgi:hypothetical protein
MFTGKAEVSPAHFRRDAGCKPYSVTISISTFDDWSADPLSLDGDRVGGQRLDTGRICGVENAHRHTPVEEGAAAQKVFLQLIGEGDPVAPRDVELGQCGLLVGQIRALQGRKTIRHHRVVLGSRKRVRMLIRHC